MKEILREERTKAWITQLRKKWRNKRRKDVYSGRMKHEKKEDYKDWKLKIKEGRKRKKCERSKKAYSKQKLSKEERKTEQDERWKIKGWKDLKKRKSKSPRLSWQTK